MQCRVARGVMIAMLVSSATLAAAKDAVEKEAPRGRLPRTVVPAHYDVRLEIDPKSERFEGESTVRVRIAEPTARIWMHGGDLEIREATLTPADGKPVKLAHANAGAGGALALTAPEKLAAGEAALHFRWRGKFDKPLSGAYRLEADGEHYVMTQMEPLGARLVFPCFDEPAFKTPWDFTLDVPKGNQVLANYPVASEEPLAAGARRVRFATTAPMATYLIAFAVGPWDVVDGGLIPKTPQRAEPLPFRGIAVKGRGKDLRYALDNTPAIVAELESYFDLPHPYPKVDLLASPDFGYGAMENVGLITYRDDIFLIGEDTPTDLRQDFWGTHAHELSHQWFGNLVTMPWWDDIWLNESFATWIATKVVVKLKPEYHAERGRMTATLYAMNADQLAATRRIHEPIDDYTDIQSAFDSISYAKGGAVLSMFESYLGPDRFRDAIRAHIRRFAGGNATSADLMESIGAATDQREALVRAFQSFTDQAGVPIVDVKVGCADGRATLGVSQRRSLPLGSTAEADQLWSIPFCVRHGAGDRSEQECMLLEKPSLSPAMTLDSCPEWVMPNSNGAGYYLFDLDPVARAALEKHFANLDAREQLAYAGSLDGAFDAGTVTPEVYLGALPRFAAAGAHEVVSAPFAKLRWIKDHLVRTAEQLAAFEALLKRTYRPVLDRVGLDYATSEDDDRRLLRTGLVSFLSRTGNDPELRHQLLVRVERMIGDGSDGAWHPDAVEPDQQRSALVVYAQERGGPGREILTQRLAKSADSRLRDDLLHALGSIVEPKSAAKVRALALDPGIKAGEAGNLLETHFSWPANRPEGRRWLRKHVEPVMKKIPAMWQPWIVWIYGDGSCSEAEAKDIEGLFAKRLAEVEGGPRTVAQALEATRLCGALVERQSAAGFGAALVGPG